jgi:hypothetical protein
MPVWRAVLLVYRELNVALPRGRGREDRFHHIATDAEVSDATESFRAFPQLAAGLTSGAAQVEANIVEVPCALTSLTADSEKTFWPSPDDTRRALEEFAPAGSHHSIFVFWPQTDFGAGTTIPCRGWGLGMGASDWSNGATYAVVANAPSSAWRREAPGEVWLHEWLHGVCHHFASQGHAMPARDADGAEVHGYERSPAEGWTEYYRDLMSGKVEEAGRSLGIPLAAWNKDATEAA